METNPTTDPHALAAILDIPGEAFIGGVFRPALSGKTFDNLNPATARSLGAVASCDAEDVDLAVRAARRVFDGGGWSRCAPEERKAVLLRLAELVREHAEELAILESLDAGKTITDCRNEIGNEVATFFQWYGEFADKNFGKVAPTGEDAFAFILDEPVGVVGLVLPWNFPLLMAAWKLAPALASGCSVVLKPAEQTPLTALRLAGLAREAGLPDGVLNVVPGVGETAGQAIGRHMDIDVVSFTGSTETGALFLQYAGQSNLKSVGLEMGGKSPFLILEDAEITDDLIENAVQAALWNGGQNCSANMRQYVPRGLQDEYVSRLAERIEAIQVGDPLLTDTDIGAMVTKDHRSRILAYIDSGLEEGARLVRGGEPLQGEDGYFLTPALFDNVGQDMRVAREEIFGPVLGVIGYKDTDDLLALAADSNFGLHASVYTRDIDRALHFARRLPCGTVSVNGFSEGDVKTPFGGFKSSGSLARDNGTEAFKQYCQTKTIWICTSSN